MTFFDITKHLGLYTTQRNGPKPLKYFCWIKQIISYMWTWQKIDLRSCPVLQSELPFMLKIVSVLIYMEHRIVYCSSCARLLDMYTQQIRNVSSNLGSKTENWIFFIYLFKQRGKNQCVFHCTLTCWLDINDDLMGVVQQ